MWYFASERLIIKAKEESFERLQKSQGKWPQSQRPQRDCVWNSEWWSALHCMRFKCSTFIQFNQKFYQIFNYFKSYFFKVLYF